VAVCAPVFQSSWVWGCAGVCVSGLAWLATDVSQLLSAFLHATGPASQAKGWGCIIWKLMGNAKIFKSNFVQKWQAANSRRSRRHCIWFWLQSSSDSEFGDSGPGKHLNIQYDYIFKYITREERNEFLNLTVPNEKGLQKTKLYSDEGEKIKVIKLDFYLWRRFSLAQIVFILIWNASE